MPELINGIGTGLCYSQGRARWQKLGEPDQDAVECFVVLFLPVVPLKLVHAFGWQGNKYNELRLPLRSEPVVKAFLRRYALLGVFLGPFAGLVLLIGATHGARGGVETHPLLGLLFLLLGAASAAALYVLGRLDQRHQDIRYLIGRTRYGSSDPALWGAELLRPYAERYGAATARAAALACLERGQLAGATFAARVATALEDRREGEALTDRILSDPRARAALQQVRRDPGSWDKVLGANPGA